MDKLLEFLKSLQGELVAYVKPGTDGADTRRKEVLDKIQTDYHSDLWQPITNVGFAAGKASRDAELNVLKARAETAEGALSTANTELETYKTKHKDLAAVQTEAASKIAAAEQKAKDAEKAASAKVAAAFKARDLATFESNLVGLGLDPDYAKAQGILFRERLGEYGEDGQATAMQSGSENIPYTVKGEALLKVVAKEVFDKAPAALKGTPVDKGGGRTASGSEGGGGTKNMYDQIKKEEADRAAANKQIDVAAAYGRGGASMQR
jgi:hypothetical protein